MRHQSVLAAAVGVALAAPALAQSAAVSLSASQTSVAPGGSVSVSVIVDYDLAGAGAGIFGDAGFYGFGGNVSASGSGAASASASALMVNADLSSGPVADASPASGVARAAGGRGLAGGLSADPVTVLTFELDVDSGAALGSTIELGWDGAVVLVRDDALETYSTDPGANQQSLSVTPVTITVGSGGCNVADLAAPFGQLTFADISAFLAAFAQQDPAADLAAPLGSFTFADISTFLGAFSAGCP